MPSVGSNYGIMGFQSGIITSKNAKSNVKNVVISFSKLAVCGKVWEITTVWWTWLKPKKHQ